MWNKKVVVVLGLALGVLAGCTPRPENPESPKRRLNDYISRSFSVKGPGDRAQLTEYLTGDAKARLAAWSDDQFKQAFAENKRLFLKLVFTEIKSASEQEVDITYELTYLDQGKGHDAKVTNKKLAQMVLDQGKWFIKDVRNIKELIEYKNEMSLP